MEINKGPPFWNKYEMEKNNEDILHKTTNVLKMYQIH